MVKKVDLVIALLMVGIETQAIEDPSGLRFVLARQDFNALPGKTTRVSRADSQFSQFFLQHSGAYSRIDANGIKFETQWIDSRFVMDRGPVLASETEDFIGVNFFTGAGAPDLSPFGFEPNDLNEFNYRFSDCDGTCNVKFFEVDGRDCCGPIYVSFYYWIHNTTYEDPDMMYATLLDVDRDSAVQFFDLTYEELNSRGSRDTTEVGVGLFAEWNLVVYETPPGRYELTISVDNDDDDENIYVDNIAFECDERTPEPTPIPTVPTSSSDYPTPAPSFVTNAPTA